MVGCCTSCFIFKFRVVAVTLLVTKQYSLQLFVLLIRESPEECVSLASGDDNITECSELDTSAAQLLDYSRGVTFVSRGH